MKDKESLIALNIAVLLFGFAGLFAKWIKIPSLGITFGRVFFSSIALSLFLLITRTDIHLKSKKDMGLIILSGAILALHWWAFLAGIQYSTVAIGTVTASSFPLFLTFLEPLVFHEPLKKKSIICAVCILIGIMITLPSASIDNTMFLGALIGLMAAIAYAVLSLFNRYFAKSYSGTIISFYEQTVACLVLLPFILKSDIHPTGTDIALLVFLGVFTTALAHTLYISCLKNIKASVAGVCSSMENVYSIVLALIFLHEIPALKTIIGAIIIIVTVYYNQKE